MVVFVFSQEEREKKREREREKKRFLIFSHPRATQTKKRDAFFETSGLLKVSSVCFCRLCVKKQQNSHACANTLLSSQKIFFHLSDSSQEKREKMTATTIASTRMMMKMVSTTTTNNTTPRRTTTKTPSKTTNNASSSSKSCRLEATRGGRRERRSFVRGTKKISFDPPRASSSEQEQEERKTNTPKNTMNFDVPKVVKICGITTAEDCRVAIDSGASHVGMILWPKSKRSVDIERAKKIVKECEKSKERVITPVAVFVDEDGATIAKICEELGYNTHAQLHGDLARQSLKDIPQKIKVIWVCSADESGKIVTEMPGESEEELASRRKEMLSGEKGWKAPIDWVNGPRKTVDYVLIDGVNAGSGEKFEWENLKVPKGCSRKGWILAGGLTPENCSEAVMVLRPNGVDVASGVCDESGVVKSKEKCDAFVFNVRAAAAK